MKDIKVISYVSINGELKELNKLAIKEKEKIANRLNEQAMNVYYNSRG